MRSHNWIFTVEIEDVLLLPILISLLTNAMKNDENKETQREKKNMDSELTKKNTNNNTT